MKKTVFVILAGLILYGCADKKAEEKAALDSVINVHDKVMGSDDHLIKNKMLLDTLLKQANLPGKDTAMQLSKQLILADSAMDNWMHNFDPDQGKKAHEEKMAYFGQQKKQIMAVDSQITAAITRSDIFLKKVKTK